MKVYIVQYLADPADDISYAGINGVFKTLEKAKEVMKEDFNSRKEELEVTEEDIENYESRLCEEERNHSIFHYGSFYSWEIYEFEVK